MRRLTPRKDLAAAEQEGIRFHFQSALTKMMGEGSALTQVEVVRLSPDGTEEQREAIPADTLLTGAGRFPELIYVLRKVETEEGAPERGAIQWETLTPYPSPFAGHDIGIFRPGEATSDYKAVVEAIGAGRRAANSVHKFLTGNPVAAPVHMIRKTTEVLTVKQIEPITISRRVKNAGTTGRPARSGSQCGNRHGLFSGTGPGGVEAVPPVRAHLLSPDGGETGPDPVARTLVMWGWYSGRDWRTGHTL